MEFVAQLLIIIVATKFAGDLAVRLGQPAVLGNLLVGILIGPAVFGWIEADNDLINTFSYIGVIMLMFFAGLETDMGEMKKNGKASVNVALGGIILPFIGGYATGVWIGMSTNESIFLGLLLSATSVSISVQTFKELGRIKSKESATVLGAALVDDIIVVILLAVMLSFVGGEEVNLALLVSYKFLFFALVIFLGWKVVPWVMRKWAKLHTPEPVIKSGIIVCFSFTVLAESLGVAGIIGAFAAGLAISRTAFHKEVERKLEPIAYTVFVPVFFVSIGGGVNFEGLGELWLFTVVLCMVAMITKWIGAGIGAKLSGFKNRSSLVVGAGMISRGEVALIIALEGLKGNLLSTQYYTATIIAIVVSTVVTPPILKWLMKPSDGTTGPTQDIEASQKSG